MPHSRIASIDWVQVLHSIATSSLIPAFNAVPRKNRAKRPSPSGRINGISSRSFHDHFRLLFANADGSSRHIGIGFSANRSIPSGQRSLRRIPKSKRRYLTAEQALPVRITTRRPHDATLRDDSGKRSQPIERQAFEVNPSAAHDFSVMLYANWIIASPAQTGVTLTTSHHASQKESLSPEKHGPLHP